MRRYSNSLLRFGLRHRATIGYAGYFFTEMKASRYWFRFIAIAGLSILVSLLLIRVIIVVPYEVFLSEEAKALPLFDQQNNDVLAEIPPPLGVSEVKRYETGSGPSLYQHGRQLKIEYTISSTELTQADISGYYRTLLEQNGWHELTEFITVGGIYDRDNACVDLYFGPEDNEYKLVIWHDFWSSSFSPHKPNSWVMLFNEWYLQPVLHCP